MVSPVLLVGPVIIKNAKVTESRFLFLVLNDILQCRKLLKGCLPRITIATMPVTFIGGVNISLLSLSLSLSLSLLPRKLETSKLKTSRFQRIKYSSSQMSSRSKLSSCKHIVGVTLGDTQRETHFTNDTSKSTAVGLVDSMTIFEALMVNNELDAAYSSVWGTMSEASGNVVGDQHKVLCSSSTGTTGSCFVCEFSRLAWRFLARLWRHFTSLRFLVRFC